MTPPGRHFGYCEPGRSGERGFVPRPEAMRRGFRRQPRSARARLRLAVGAGVTADPAGLTAGARPKGSDEAGPAGP
jgi:hypothetical protein